MTYISRANGQSVMAACAYYDGEQKYSEYDHQWKYPHSQPERVVLHEVMLPPNAPPEYADSERLWNAVDAAEKKVNAQTARRLMIALPRELTYEQNVELIRSYCDQEFVSKGMICDLYFHDSGDGNPHVHLLLTLRAMDEQGHWLPKAKTVYVLDENGNRIKNKDGKWRRQTIETVDWNDHKYGEIWRHNWEVIQNDALERAGSEARVDMRSLERQGITDRVPQQHLGPAAAAMERKGIETDKGNENRRRIGLNKMLASIKKTLKGVTGWLDELNSIMQHQEVLEHPQQYQLIEVMQSYMAMREAGREYWSKYSRDKAGINDLKEMSAALIFMKENDIYTVDDLSAHLVKTKAEIAAIENNIRSNEQSIRDINGFFEAVEVYNELKPVQDKYTICTVTLENKILSHLPVYSMSHHTMGMYALYMSTLGNMPELFAGNAHASHLREPGKYDVPEETLAADPQFARIMEEAQKYIGYPYVWGGANPETSFDCSGFVSWVYTESDVYNTGRLGATGLYGICKKITSEQAQPGDLVFFEGTMGDAADGITHVGIYVGGNHMLHCGSPIGYADLTESYWRKHFYAFGRVPYER